MNRIPFRGWLAIAGGAILLLILILYFFTIEEIELGVPPKVKFKRRSKTYQAESETHAAQTGSSTVTQTASSGGVNVGDGSAGPTFTGAIHGDVFIGASPKHEDQLTEAPTQTERLQPNLVHPYPLQANFTGRVQERQDLTRWLTDKEHPICELIAMGGMGKSAVAWVWVTQDVLTSTNLKLDAVMWWSFQDKDSSFSNFLDEALKYLTGEPINKELFPSAYDRAQELRRQVQARRVLFVLDGFEWQLRTFATLDAAYRQTSETSPEARRCVDPNAARLLPYLASGPTGAKVLLTTRLTVTELEDAAGDPLAGVYQFPLTELPRDDAVKFMRAQGVTKGTDGEIANACRPYGNHPLSLRLLSGLIEHDAQMPGDIEAAPRIAARPDFLAAQRQILEQSYSALPDGERTLLSQIAAFRTPVTYKELAILNHFTSEEHCETALFDLQARGLLQRNRTNDRYDIHPLVRRYAYDRLSDKTSIHTRLRDYFAAIPLPDPAKLTSVIDLGFVIERYHHTVCAGQYDEALQLLDNHIVPPLYFRFGDYRTCIELLEALLPDMSEERFKHKIDRGLVISTLGSALSKIGELRRAFDASQTAAQIAKDVGQSPASYARGLTNLAKIQVALGMLKSAEENLRTTISGARELKDVQIEAEGHMALGLLLGFRSAFADSDSEFEAGQSIADYYGPTVTNFVSTVRADRAYIALLNGRVELALGMAREARAKAEEVAKSLNPFERDFIRAHWMLGLALMAAQENMDDAATHLEEALTRCRRTDLVEAEPGILLAWATWHRAKDRLADAKNYALEALAIADRCEYRLVQADIHNFLAQVALDAADRETARKEAEIAKERASCDGPPYYYKPALDEAERMLKGLSAD